MGEQNRSTAVMQRRIEAHDSLAHISAAAEALSLCYGLAREAGAMTDEHATIYRRGQDAIGKLGEAAMTAAIATGGLV